MNEALPWYLSAAFFPANGGQDARGVREVDRPDRGERRFDRNAEGGQGAPGGYAPRPDAPRSDIPVSEGGAIEAAPESEAEPEVRAAESLSDQETRYDRAVAEEADERHAAAERLRADPLTERLETPPDDAA